MKKVILTICLILGAGVLSILTFLIGLIIKHSLDNNRILNGYKAQLQEIEHPSQTSSITTKSMVSRPPGNGSNCYYFVAEIRKFHEKREDIAAFYEAQGIRVVLLENSKFPQEVPYGFHQLESWNLKEEPSNQNIYLVYILDADFANYDKNVFDLRCN